jgi:hypothetical protein
MSGGFNILPDGNKGHEFVCSTRRGIVFQICKVSGVCFLLKLAGYWRDRQGIIKMARGWRDIGWIFQLLES